MAIPGLNTPLRRGQARLWADPGTGPSVAFYSSTKARYVMRAMDASDQVVYWEANSPTALPPGTVPPASGELRDVQILYDFQSEIYSYTHPERTILANSVATEIVDLEVAANSVAGGLLHYLISANSGFEFQVLSGTARFLAANKAGTITVSTPSLLGTQDSLCTTGTLTNSLTVTAVSGKITLLLTATTSLIPALLQASWRIWWDGVAQSVIPR